MRFNIRFFSPPLPEVSWHLDSWRGAISLPGNKILKQENELLEERLKKAAAELDEKTRALLTKADPVEIVQAEARKAASNRNAASKFFRTTANLLGLLLVAGCLYWLNAVSNKQNQQFTQEQEERKQMRAEMQKIQDLLKKPIYG